MRRLLKFYKYAFAWENYLLLWRAIQAARLVRLHLNDQSPSPNLTAAIRAVAPLYLLPQPDWQISNLDKIARFAHLIVSVPTTWGQCVQQSLIAYHLLNGYGAPARIFFGIKKGDAVREGHAWVARLDHPEEAFGEWTNPHEKFAVVYSSSEPARAAPK